MQILNLRIREGFQAIELSTFCHSDGHQNFIRVEMKSQKIFKSLNRTIELPNPIRRGAVKDSSLN